MSSLETARTAQPNNTSTRGGEPDPQARRGPASPEPDGRSNKRPAAVRSHPTGVLAPTVYLPRDLRNPEPLDRLQPDGEPEN